MESIGTLLSHLKKDSAIKTINAISFTMREVDVIACLTNGRSIKKIASLLSISPKTAEVHIRNVMLKIECNSREKIVDFIELSQNCLMIKEHYYFILEKYYFTMALKNTKHLIEVANYFIQIIYEDTLSEEKRFLIEVLQEVLNIVNIKSSKISLKDQSSYPTNTLYIVTNEVEEKMLNIRLKKEKLKTNDVVICFNISPDSLLEKFNCHYIFVDQKSSFYLMIFDILDVISPLTKVSNIRESFIKKFHSSHNAKEPFSNIDNSSKAFINNLNPMSNMVLDLSKKIRPLQKQFFLMILGLLIIIIPGIFFYNFISQRNVRYVQTDLLLPSKETFLTRKNLLKDIDRIFHENARIIKHVVIIGIGGVGKTTIARNYAISHNNPIYWEINAENEIEIIKAFERFAIALSENEDEKQEIAFMYKLNNMEYLKTKLMVLVQNHLKQNPHWLLIYDNVDNINDIISYLPHNENVWGRGNVLILTRNQNIVNCKYIDRENILHVPELTSQEKEKLFLSIHQHPKETLNNKTFNDTSFKHFLNKIPPFPLDITTAAFFLKNTNMRYEEYLKHIESYDLAFRDLNDSIIKDTDNNFKTRYNIISSTIQKIINSNIHFKNSLLQISLLDPNTIPLELLDDENKSILVLARELSRYSLVNYENTITSNSISLHRSVHHIIYLNLKNELSSKSGLATIQQLNKRISSKLSTALNTDQIDNIRAITLQSEEFMKKITPYSTINLLELKYQTGRAYRYLGRFKEAIQLFESIENYNQDIDVLLELGTTYKNIGKYKKAVLLIESALKLAEKNYGSESIPAAQVKIRLDTVYRKIKQYHKAKEVLEDSLDIHKRHKNVDPGDIAWIYTKLGHLSVKLGYLKEGIELFNKSLDIQTKLYGKNNIRTAWTYVRMANAYKNLNQNKIALEMLKNSLDVYQQHYGKIHPKSAWVLCSVGEIEGLLGNFDQAEKDIQEALKIQKQYFGENSIRLSWALNKLGALYKSKGLDSKANYYFELAEKPTDKPNAEEP